jgi:uncharacterized protein (TIGR03437 family)
VTNLLDAESTRNTVVSGEWAAIYGINMSATTRTWTGNDFNGNNLPATLDNVSVKFNGLPAPVFYISPTQLDVQVPAGLSGPVNVSVTYNNSASAAFGTTAVANAPSIYYYPAGTKVYAVVQHFDQYGNVSLAGDPAVIGIAYTKAHPGETIVIYVNGLATSPAGTILGAIAYSSPVTVSFNSTTVTADYAGVAFAGGFQVNVKVPASLAPGDYNLSVSTQGQSSPVTGIILTVGP